MFNDEHLNNLAQRSTQMKDGLSIYFEFLINLFNIETKFDINAHSDLPKGDVMYDANGELTDKGDTFSNITYARKVVADRKALIRTALADHPQLEEVSTALDHGVYIEG